MPTTSPALQDAIAANVANGVGLSVAPNVTKRADQSGASSGESYNLLNYKTPTQDAKTDNNDNSADLAAQAAALAALVNPLLSAYGAAGTARTTGDSRARSDYRSTINQYDDQYAIDQGKYTGQVTQNEQNLTGNRQAALLQASQGAQGLRAVLAAMGALNGTGSVLAGRVVSQAANKDIGDAQNTFETNAGNLTGAWADTEANDKQRRTTAKNALDASLNANKTSYLNSRIEILGKLANAYGPGSAKGQEYANEAAQLYEQVAGIPQGQAVSYTPVSSLYSPQTLSKYLAGTNNLQVEATSGNSQPSSPSVIATVSKRKDEIS